jgi:two-component system phosphate regulon response regulator PhoB
MRVTSNREFLRSPHWVVPEKRIAMARVLLVEDDQALAELLRYNLEHAGYDVETIGHGDAAHRRLSDDLPELLLLDWVLPGTSGLELCRRLRKRALTRHLLVIMLTARNDDADRMLAIATGADDFVVKPFSVSDLMLRIAALIDRHRIDARAC